MKSIAETKALFFDKEAIKKAFGRSELKVLSKFGAYVRRSARQSIKKGNDNRVSTLLAKLKAERNPKKRATLQRQIDAAKKKAVSLPGKPPKGHGQQLLKTSIQFAADPTKRTVVIGPTRLNKPGLVTQTLEYGGTTTIKARRKTRKARVKARPFMGPAFKTNQPKLSTLWADSVK